MKKQLSKFVIVALGNAVINFAVFYLLYKMIKINYTIACAAAFIAAVATGFFINKKWTFNCKSKEKRLFFKYLLVYSISLILSIPLIRVQVEQFSINPFYANLIVMMMSSIINFAGIKYFIFDKVK